MADPIKVVYDDGQELLAIRCPYCHDLRLLDYACTGCRAAKLKKALNIYKTKLNEAILEAALHE